MHMSIFSKTVELGENHKALWPKRLIAGALDAVLLFLTSYLLFFIANKTPIAGNARSYKEKMTIIEDEAKLDTGYGYKVVVNKGEEGGYLLHYDEANNEYYIVKNTEYPSSEITTEYKTIINANTEYSELQFSYSINNYGMLFGAGFIAELIFFFVVPVVNKRRATVGQLLCGLQLISTKRMDRAAWYQLLGRFFFIYIVESAIPYFIMGLWVIVVVPLATIIIRYFNKENRSLYDFISFTRLIEAATFVPPFEEEDEEETEKETKKVYDINRG